MTLTKAALDNVQLGQVSLEQAIAAGDVTIEGRKKALGEFLGAARRFPVLVRYRDAVAAPRVDAQRARYASRRRFVDGAAIGPLILGRFEPQQGPVYGYSTVIRGPNPRD